MLAPKALHIYVMRTKADSTKVRGILYVKVRELRGLPEGLANESIEVEVLLDEHSDRVCATDGVGVDTSGHANFDKPGVRASNTLVVQHEWQRTVTLRVVIPHAAKGMQSADGSVAARHHGARLVYTQLTAPLESIGWLLTHTMWLAGEHFNARVEMAFYPSEHLCRGHLAHELDEPASEEVIARARKAEADAISGTAEAKGPGMGNGGTKSVAAAAGPAATIGSPTVVAERTRGGATAGAVDASAGPAFSPDQVMLSGASMTALQRLREFNPLEDPMVMLVELERAEGVIIGDYSVRARLNALRLRTRARAVSACPIADASSTRARLDTRTFAAPAPSGLLGSLLHHLNREGDASQQDHLLNTQPGVERAVLDSSQHLGRRPQQAELRCAGALGGTARCDAHARHVCLSGA